MPVLKSDAGDIYMVSYSRSLLLRNFSEENEPSGSPVHGKMTQYLVDALQSAAGQSISDVFILNHGYWNNTDSAEENFINWVNGWWSQRPQTLPKTFNPLFIGMHWPSNPLPFSSSESDSDSNTVSTPLSADAVLGALDIVPSDYPNLDALVTKLVATADSIDWDAPISDDIAALLSPALQEIQASSPTVTLSFPTQASQLTWWGLAILLLSILSDVDARLGPLGKLIAAVLNAMMGLDAFKRYSNDAAKFGATAVHDAVSRFGRAAAKSVRFHVMGHSLGTIVTSSLLLTGEKKKDLPKIGMVFLAQGALPAYSFASTVSYAGNLPGTYSSVVGDAALVTGPFVGSFSSRDAVVGVLYLSCALHYGWIGVDGHDVTTATKDYYYGLATTGFEGSLTLANQQTGPAIVVSQDQSSLSSSYQPGHVYSLDASAYISGHSDICNPTVSKAFWAVYTSAVS